MAFWRAGNDGPCCWEPAQVEGKAAARETLRYRLGLTGWGDKPLVGVVTRLTAQKGALPLCFQQLHRISLVQGSQVSLCMHIATLCVVSAFEPRQHVSRLKLDIPARWNSAPLLLGIKLADRGDDRG